MVKRSKGIMANTRQTLKKKPSDRGMPPITTYLKHFEVGEKANIKIESSSQKGQPHKRFQGRVGTIMGKRGKAYIVRVQFERSYKDIIARPEHLKRVR